MRQRGLIRENWGVATPGATALRSSRWSDKPKSRARKLFVMDVIQRGQSGLLRRAEVLAARRRDNAPQITGA